jgi:hypothetical protein
MPTTEPPAESVADLLKLAAATSYCRPALRGLAEALPADPAVLTAALEVASRERKAKEFTNLYVAGLYAGRRLAGEVLALGACLLPDANLVFTSALRLDGNVADALTAAVRSGRMSIERDATALVVAWLDCERRNAAPPADLLALTRKRCREAARMERFDIKLMLGYAADLAGDPVAARILNLGGRPAPEHSRVLGHVRECATEPGWDEAVPASLSAGVVLGAGATVTRAVPKAGRNDPCPCGSGRKFKQCCEGKLTLDEQYAVDGVPLREAATHPELLLTAQRIDGMRAYELYGLDTKLIPPYLVPRVVSRLSVYNEFPRVVELLQAFGREAFSEHTLDLVAFDMFMAGEIDTLRWLMEWAPEMVVPTFEMEVLLANPDERLGLLSRKAAEAFAVGCEDQQSASLLFCDVAYAALRAEPALGLLVARGVLPVCGRRNQGALLDEMDDARDRLDLDDDEPGYAIVESADKEFEDRTRHAQDLENARAESAERIKQRELEIHRLKAKIDAMQEALTKREAEGRKPLATSRDPAPAAPAGETAETRELRDTLRRLKENLKIEHDERNRAMRELRSAREQLRRTTRDHPESGSVVSGTPPVLSSPTPEDDEAIMGGVEWERQPLRVTEASPAFRVAVQQHPRPAAAAALLVAGRLAGGDPSIWKTVRALKARPGILRARVAGDYRLLFETTPDQTLRLVDFILRRDLDRWLAGSR